MTSLDPVPIEEAAPAEPRTIVLVLRQLGYARLFDGVVRGLLERGNRVHLICEREVGNEREQAWLRALRANPAFSVTVDDPLTRGRWFRYRSHLRRLSDYLYYASGGFPGVESAVAKSRRLVHPLMQRLVDAPGVRRPRVRDALRRFISRVESLFPPSVHLLREVEACSPDVIVVVPHLTPGHFHSEYVRVARALGVPSCICVASWDNLTTKQQLREIPDRVIVWNELQRDEAERLHGVPPSRVVITGAQVFDDWFEREARPRAEFCELVGLDPRKPYLLYVGSALYPSALAETTFVRDVWLPDLRGDPRLASVGILVRPHPRRNASWAGLELATDANAAVWPPADVPMPVDDESRADYFDSLYHCAAVVGINTTALIEAAIVGRPAHTLLVPEFAESQFGSSHFAYLSSVGGGILRVAESASEHRDALVRSLGAHDPAWDERRTRFMRTFVRPYGLDAPALPRVLDAIVETASYD